MKNSFVPQKLDRARREVARQHPLKSTLPKYEGDQDFVKMLKYWAYMGSEEVEQEANLIPPRRLRQLVEYVSKNIYKLPMRNFATIIRLRASDEIFLRLFALWLDAYDNEEFNRLLRVVARVFIGRADNVFQNSQLIVPIFSEWIGSDNIPLIVGKTCIRYKSEAGGFEKALSTFSVSPESSLGKACIDSFYTFCGREDYIISQDYALERVLRRYNENQIHAFMHNFLAVLVVSDFQKFYVTGKYLLQKYTNAPGTKPFQKFFANYPKELVDKYQRWLNYITIRESFHNNTRDERLIFWSKFVPYMQSAHMEPVSKSLLMKFENYGIVEFTEATMGALYIYEINDFVKRIQPKSRTHNNNEFRSYLYNSPQVERIVHNGNWRRKTEWYLRRNQITKK